LLLWLTPEIVQGTGFGVELYCRNSTKTEALFQNLMSCLPTHFKTS